MVNVSTKTKDLGSRAQGCARVSRGFIRALQSWQGFVHGSDLGLGRCLVEAVRVEGFRFALLECGVRLSGFWACRFECHSTVRLCKVPRK